MKPVPEPTPLTRPFWDGCLAGELRLQRCAGCGDFRFYPAEACHACGSDACAWDAVSGTGRIYSWIVVHRPVDESWTGDVPYAIVVVALDVPGEPLLPGTLVGCEPERIAADMPVEAEFEAVNAEIALLRWRPARAP